MTRFDVWFSELFHPSQNLSLELSGGFPWPLWTTILLLVIIIFVTVRIYLRAGDLNVRHKYTLLALRAIVIMIVIMMLGQWVVIRQKTSPPFLALIIDDSMSMSVEDEPHFKKEDLDAPVAFSTRWHNALAIATSSQDGLLHLLETHYRVQTYLLDNQQIDGEGTDGVIKRLSGTEPKRKTSPLGRTIIQVMDWFRSNELAAVVMITDGINNEGPGLIDAAEQARRRSIPIFFIGVGDETQQPDIGIRSWIMEDRVFLGERVIMRVGISGKHVAAREILLKLYNDGTNELLSEGAVKLDENGSGEGVLSFVARESGRLSLRLECETLKNERALENNKQQRVIWVEDRPINLLLVGAVPGLEYRFLRNMLRREETVKLTCVLLSADAGADPEVRDGTLILGGSPDFFAEYDVIILVDIPVSGFPGRIWKGLAEYVENRGRDGGLVFVAGEQVRWEELSTTPLGSILPVELTAADGSGHSEQRFDRDFKIIPSEDGLRLSWFQLAQTPEESRRIWLQLPGVYWFLPSLESKPGARTLASIGSKEEGQKSVAAAFVFQYVGASRVLFHATDETWRWRKAANGEWYRQFWLELVRCMARGRIDAKAGAILTTDRSVYAPGDSIILTLERLDSQTGVIRGDEVNIWLEYEGKQRRVIKLTRQAAEANVFQTVIRDLPPGVYEAWLPGGQSDIRTSFTVRAPMGELEVVDPAWDEMRQAATRCGGKVYPAAQARRLIEDLPSGRGAPVEALPPVTLWNHPLILLLVVVLLGAEWALRKMWGLM